MPCANDWLRKSSAETTLVCLVTARHYWTRLPVPVTVRSLLATIPSDRKRESSKFKQPHPTKNVRTRSEYSAADPNADPFFMTRWLAGLRNGLKSCVRAQSSVASSPRAASPHQGDTRRLIQIVAPRLNHGLRAIFMISARRRGGVVARRSIQPARPRSRRESKRRDAQTHPTHRSMRAQATSSTTAAPG